MVLQSTQIGGKGTVRRKVKRTGHNFAEKQTKESREYSMKIKTINKMIAECDDETYILFKKYINEELEDMGNSIEKYNFLKQYKSEFEKCKEDPFSYIFSLLISKVDKPMEFNCNSFLKLKKMFTLEHLAIFIQFIYETETALMKKSYIETEVETEVELEDEIKDD
tara:strand:- start:20 stop:517 length:498 start_codon:yes stop_codon:yes gene_type:complete